MEVRAPQCCLKALKGPNLSVGTATPSTSLSAPAERDSRQQLRDRLCQLCALFAKVLHLTSLESHVNVQCDMSLPLLGLYFSICTAGKE